MPFNMEGMVRGIGQLQASAMENLWDMPTSGMLQPGAGIGGGSAMLEPGAGIGGGSAMLEPGFGPFGQAFAGSMLQPDFGMSRDSSGMTALQDMQSLKAHVSAEADRYDAGRAKAAQQSMARANELQVLNQHYNMDAAPADNTQSSASTTPAPTSAGGGGVFPFAEMARGYIPDDLKSDPELMKIIATAAKAESQWNPAAVNPNGGATGLWQFHPKGMGAGATQAQLLDPNWQAQRIVPKFVEAYRRRAQSGQTNPADIAAWVAGQVERPEGYETRGSASWNNYARAYGQVGQTPQAPAPAGSGAPYQVNRTSQFGLGLSREESLAFCGPAAALALTKFYGNNIPVEKVRQAAIEVGWTKNVGMAGPQSQVNLLNKLGLPSQMAAWNDAQAQQLLASGKPLIIDTPGHYFTADQYDPARGYRVGTSGTDLRQGGEWMTPQDMARLAVAGTPRQMIWKT